MKWFAVVLLGVLLLPFAVGAQDSPTLPDSFSFDYTLHIAVEGLDTFAMTADLSGAGTMDSSAPGFDLTAAGDIQLGSARHLPVDTVLRWVDDALYVDSGDGWQVIDGAGEYAAHLIEQYAGLSADANALAQWDVSGVDGVTAILSALAVTGTDPNVAAGASGVDGDTVMSLVDIHLQALMQTDAFIDAVGALAAAQGNNLIIASRDELAQIVRENGVVVQNGRLRYIHYFEGEDMRLDRFTVELSLPLEPAALGYPDAPFTVTAALDVRLHDDAPQAIVAPDDAQAVSAFAFASPETETADAGSAQLVYFETVGEGETYNQSFDALVGDTVTITVRGLGLSFDPYLTLSAPDGEILAENDDHEAPAFGVGDYDSQIVDFTVPADGTYSIEVTELSGYAGSFVLTVNLER